jgi:hypothetical protein
LGLDMGLAATVEDSVIEFIELIYATDQRGERGER